MKVRSIAVLGITLAISSTTLWAGDASSEPPKTPDHVQAMPEPTTPPRTESRATYEERLTAPITRDEMSREQRERMAYAPQPASPRYDPRHPQTGQLIDHGLFNRTGPNDFGA